jgi:hypothetical protein
MTFLSIKLWRNLVLAAVACVVAHSAAAQASRKCRPADNHSANMISDITRYLTATDARTIYNRDSIMHLPVVTARQVTLVTDERICTKVVQAYRTLPNPYTPASLYVVKLGSTGYVAHDSDRKVGEFSVIFVFNTKYARVGGWGGG